MILKLITRYGAFGSCVSDSKGNVFHCSQYVLACVILKKDVLVYCVKDENLELAKKLLVKEYGVFNYDGLKKNTYIQTFAQLYRLRMVNGKQRRSTLYENFVIPRIKSYDRGIDFGAGQGDYVKMLRGKGYNINEMEFFRRKGSRIDLKAVHGMIDRLIHDVKQNGQYDYVVCDSVLNSVDSVEAENAVVSMINILCKKGGIMFFSGRPLKNVEAMYNMKKNVSNRRMIQFLDENGFTAIYRKGQWFYQKFHSQKQIQELCDKKKLKLMEYCTKIVNSSFQVVATKIDDLSQEEVKEAIDFEFNLKYNEKDSYGRGNDVYEVFKDRI